MISISDYLHSTVRFSALVAFVVLLLVSPALVRAQTTISTGSIQGTIVDPSGAVVGEAKVTITDSATGQAITQTTTSAGTYTSGALIPGNYLVRVEAKGFQTLDETVSVDVGVTISGNFKLQLGDASQVIDVQAGTLQVNTEQATVQGVINTEQIENLPINGRNFLDLAQLEPGVQIQDGGNFDPTKKGFSSISFGGRFGRASRSMESTRVTKRSERPRKIFPTAPFRNFRSGNRCWICRRS
jgi:hypothetical protein